jgi:hypothetical protein
MRITRAALKGDDLEGAFSILDPLLVTEDRDTDFLPSLNSLTRDR